MTASITDFSHFAELRREAGDNNPAALREAAGQFEALFLQTMLKNMRAASLGDSLFGDSESHELYEGMLDQQFAIEMASGDGIGLAAMLVRQLGGQDTDVLPTGLPLGTARASRPTAPGNTPAWRDPESFARAVWPHAERVAQELDVAPEGVLAQAALETGWGRHVASRPGGETSYNLFGIKSGSSWSGDVVAQKTLEFDGEIARHEVARFRVYEDVGATFDDYANLIRDNARYSGVRGHGNDIEGFAEALQASGYATDPEYASKISRVASSDTMTRVMDSLKNARGVPIRP